VVPPDIDFNSIQLVHPPGDISAFIPGIYQIAEKINRVIFSNGSVPAQNNFGIHLMNIIKLPFAISDNIGVFEVQI
jgi:hypothetical protein